MDNGKLRTGQPQRLLLILLVLFCFTGCRKVEKTAVQKVPQRIICLSPASAEICFAVGSGDKVVACSEFCDYPEEAKNIPVVGGFDGKTLSIEKILGFNPDFVYLTGGMHDFLIPQLEDNGISYYVSTAETVNGVLQEITDIGKITGNETTAEEITDGIKAVIKGVAEMCAAERVAEEPAAAEGGEDSGAQGETSPSLNITASKNERLPKVYWEVWNAPYMSAGNKSFINDLIAVSGGKNIFDDVDEAYPIVSEESLIVRQPEIILIPASSGVSVENVAARAGWESVPALKNGKIFIVDDNLYTRPGPGIGKVISELAQIINR